ncbi:MAG: acetoacetate--CoA ligase [Bdellovibrionales bacterium]|nr:acetoacetate--CoA ligase [Bdellovibrionales bacterium]
MARSDLLWNPSPEHLKQSQIAQFMTWLGQRGYPSMKRYNDLYQWSIDKPDHFWSHFLEWSGIVLDKSYDRIVSKDEMFGTKWFAGARLNFARVLLQNIYEKNPLDVVIVEITEERERREITAKELLRDVSSVWKTLRDMDVKPRDRVAAVVTNGYEAIVSMLACTSLGAIWTSCSPDFGASGIMDRFGQIKPKVLIAVSNYSYNGRNYSMTEKLDAIVEGIDSLSHLIVVEKNQEKYHSKQVKTLKWKELIEKKNKTPIEFVSTPFDHPAYILYSSGTTGAPKCIVHGAGGTLLQHQKELRLHGDLNEKSVFMYYTTCGWMMWNWMVSSLMTGCRIVLYDGSANYPSIERLWRIIESESITHFGTSAKFLSSCRMEGFRPRALCSMDSLSTIFSTGSPLTPEDFDWAYQEIKKNMILSSISGGTDIVSCFFLGCPIVPVYRGELQCRGLGMDVAAFNDQGEEIVGEKGELVCKKPFPSMPLEFWNDPKHKKYKSSYFEKFSGVWAHGDYVMINDRGGAVIYGRSDATLNPGGIRIGTAEIYRQVEKMGGVVDSLVVGRENGRDEEILLFLVLDESVEFNASFKTLLKDHVRKGASPRHVPTHIFRVKEIPYTISGKKVELAVKNIFSGQKLGNEDALKNPKSLAAFEKIAEDLLD